MGCATSKIDNEENVSRCRSRKRFMKQAVASRHALAAAHIAYIHSLKNVGAAFRQFAESDMRGCRSPIASLPKTSSDPLPPPRPTFLLQSDSPASPLHRAVSLPPPILSNGAADKPDKSKLLLFPPPEGADTKARHDYLYDDVQPPPPPPPATSTFAWDIFHSAAASLNLQGLRKSKQIPEAMDEHGYGESSPAPYAGRIYCEDQMLNDCYGSSPENVMIKSEVVNELVCLERPEMAREMALGPWLRKERELVDVLREVDDCFLKAYESGKEIGRLLEALKFHYHSNFLNPKGYNDHIGASIFSSLSWRQGSSHSQRMTLPLKGMGEDISGCGIAGSHASTLDRLFAWEKRLYEEVKGAETLRLECEKQCSLLRRKNTKGAGNQSIEKTRAVIKSLQTKTVIALQAVDTAAAAALKLRDEELYPQLLEILHGLTLMWKEMYDCHRGQEFICHQGQEIILPEIRALEELESADATSNLHRQATSQLEMSVTTWYNSLSKVISTQREYLHNINAWLRLSLLPLETEPRDRSSPARNDPPPIYYLCIGWQQAFDRLPDKVALEAIRSFSAVIKLMVDLQSDEVRHRKRAEALSKDLHKRVLALQNYERKHADAAYSPHKRNEFISAIVPYMEPHTAKQSAIDALKRKLDDENEKVKKAIQDTRAMTINGFQTSLPSIFQAITSFAHVCYQTYERLYTQLNCDQVPRITDK